MTDTIESVPARIDQQQLAQELVEAARAEGVELVGPGGLLTGLTKTVLETALEAEMSEHLGYERHDPVGRDSGNSRNGTRTKTVLTGIGPVQIEVPRDRDASFDPVIVRQRQRRLDGIDEIVTRALRRSRSSHLPSEAAVASAALSVRRGNLGAAVLPRGTSVLRGRSWTWRRFTSWRPGAAAWCFAVCRVQRTAGASRWWPGSGTPPMAARCG